MSCYFCVVKIALIGYGKMGRTIEKICSERGHIISYKFDAENPFTECENLDADCAIEFTSPELAVQHIKHAVRLNVPLVVGTTGWYNEFSELVDFVNRNSGSLFYATNFSVGVNLFFQINKILSKLMSSHPDYGVSMTEIHHTEKKDAPSGTAITLAEVIVSQNTSLSNWELILDNNNKFLDSSTGKELKNSPLSLNKNGILPIIAERLPEVPGTHIIKYESDVDSIEIRHDAKNRLGFALGAVLASEWLVDKKGVFTMSDLLSL